MVETSVTPQLPTEDAMDVEVEMSDDLQVKQLPSSSTSVLNDVSPKEVVANDRKRRSACPDEYPFASHPCSDNIRQKPDIVTFHQTPGVFRFRRRVSTAPKIDYFSVYPLPTHVIHTIFSNLNKKDLFSVMRSCKKLYEAGTTAKNWANIDLYNCTISDTALMSILDRNAKVVRLAEANVTDSPPESTSFANNWSLLGPPAPPFSFQLTHLDLGRATFSNMDVIVTILSACTKLQGLSLEGIQLDEENEMCNAIGRNHLLKYLDMTLVRGITPAGALAIVEGCRRLEQVNMSWSSLTNESVSVLCNGLPHTLTHLNLAGTLDKKSITDDDVYDLVENCPNLVDCDLSDNISLQNETLECLLHLDCLDTLSLNRCYGITPMNFLNCGHLETLNVIGCITDDGESALKNGLPATRVNSSLFSYTAKPTVPPLVTSIWGQRTRDIYN